MNRLLELAGTTHTFSGAEPAHGIQELLPGDELRVAPTSSSSRGSLVVRLTLHRAGVHVRRPLPGLLLAAEPQLVLISVEPRIVLLQNMLTPTECQVAHAVVRLGHSMSVHVALMRHADLPCVSQ